MGWLCINSNLTGNWYMFSSRTTPKDELTFHEEVTTVLRHRIEGPILRANLQSEPKSKTNHLPSVQELPRLKMFVFFFFFMFDLFIFDFLQCRGNIRSALVQKNTCVENVVFFGCFLFFLFFCFFVFWQKPHVQSMFFSLCKCAHFLTTH